MMVRRIKPRRIRIEASSLCQLKCPACPVTHLDSHPVIGKGYMKSRDFTFLLDRNPFIKDVELSNYGEMFLNPQLVEIMQAAHERRVRLSADNGVNFNHAEPEQLEGLVKHGFYSIVCSIDGASSGTYSQYRVNGELKNVLSNIRTLNRIKKKYRSRRPLLSWQFVVFGHNEHEIPKARKLAAELGMLFFVKLPWRNQFSPPKDKELVRKETGFFSREEYRNSKGLDLGHVCCRMLWEQPQINWDGGVLGCPRNFWGEFGGNVFNDGLLNSINSPKMTAARRMLKGETHPPEDVPCTTCKVYLDRVATGKFVTYSIPERFIRWLYNRTKTIPQVRSFRHYLRRKGI